MINNYDDFINAKDLREENSSQDILDYETYEFLQFMYQDCAAHYIEFRAVSGINEKRPVQKFHSMFDRNLPFEELQKLNSEGYNILFGLATRKDLNGTKGAVHEVCVLVVDIDPKPGENKLILEQQIKKRAQETGLEPTGTTNSGNGFHLYYKLKKNIKVRSEEDIQLVEGATRWLASMFGGDNICDISRAMRLPGFYNNKDPKNPKKTSVIKLDKSIVYDISDFGTIQGTGSKVEHLELGEIPKEVPRRFYDCLNDDYVLQTTWNGERDDLENQTGSGYDMALGTRLKNKGFSKEEIARIWQDAFYKKKNPRTRSYIQHTLSKIFSQTSSELVNSEQSIKNIDLSEFTLKKEDFDTSNIKYLIEDFLPGNSLILLTSKFGTGKSILELALTKKFIEDGNKVVIVDADMSVQVIAERLEAASLEQYMDSELFYFHCSKLPMKIDAKNQEWNTFKGLVERHEQLIIFFDTFKDLVPTGADIDHDAAVIPIMSELKSIRDMGHTVVLLHHIGKDGGKNNPFKNSGSIADAVDVAYLLDRKMGDTDEFTLTAFKQRIPVSKEVRFELDKEFNLLTKETQQDIELYNRMIAVYNHMTENKDAESGYLQKDIITAMNDRISKHKLIEVLRAGVGKLWDKTQGDRKSLIYKPIELDIQKSKSLPPYIAKSLGFMDSEL